MAIDEITKAITTGTRTAQEPQADEDVSIIKDMAMGIPRGLEGAVQGTYNFFDYITGDELLPDYDTRYLGRSSTIAGGLVEGVSQFLTGFIPAVGVASKVGKFAQLSSKVGAKTALKVAKGNKNLKYSELRKLKGFKKKSKKQSILEGVSAGATADFMVFDAQEQRLSNLLLMNESLRNPVTEYLAADGDDGEIEGRFKNVIEGLFLEAGIGGSVAAFIKTVKVIKARNAKLKEGKDKVEATQEALNESDLDADELANSRNEADEKLNADEAEIDDTGFTREPVETNFDDLSFQQLREEAKRQGLPAGGTKADLKARLEEKQAKINEKADTPTETKFDSADEPNLKPEDAQKTQRGNTDPTYEKVGALLGEGNRLDMGAGLGQGASKIGADTYEPFPKAGFTPDYTKASDIPSGSYDNITSLNTLNVVPPDIRKGIVNDLGRILREGGTAIIQTRDVNQVKGIKNFTKGKEKGSKVTSDGTYQKGFTKQELKDYIQETLGDGYEVTIVPSKANINGSAVQVKKLKKNEGAPKPDADEGGAPKPDADEGVPQSFKDDLKNDGSFKNKRTVNETVSIFKDLKTGGKQAILSAARAVKTSDAAAALARALSEKRLSEVTELPKTTAAELTRDSLRMAEIFGGDKNGWTARISKLGDSAEDLARVQAEQKSLYDLLNIYAEEISAMAKKFDEADKGNGLSVDSARTDLFSALDQYTEMQRIWSLYGRNLSLGLLQRKFLYKNGFRSRKFGFDTKKYKSKNAQEQYRNHARGSRREKKMVKLLMLATSKDQIDDQLKALTKLSIGARGRALFDMNREYWINSLLSAPTTQLVNIMGNMLTYAMRSAEVAVGATLTGNTQLLKSQLNLAYHVESIRESWHLMKLALKSDEAITLANHRAFSDASHELGAITGDNMNAVFGGRLSEDGLLYNATNWMGTVARLPSRGLLGMDEFFKALSYRQYMRTELAVEGLNKGIKEPKALAKYVEEGLEQHLTSTGRAFSEENILRDANKLADEKGLRFKDRDDFVEEYMNTNYRPDDHYRVDENGTSHYIRGGETAEELSMRGQQYAMVNTHTQDSSLKSMRTISKLIAENPALTYVVPFVRTPTNILTFGVSRSALAMADFKGMGKALQGFKKEYRDMMSQADQRTHAELVGRLSTAVSVSVALMYYINANKSFITGYGAKNKERRDAEKLGGFQEYSFRIPANSMFNSGDKDKYISYQRLDPMATMVGIIADIAEYSKYDESGTDSTASLMFSNLASTVVNNITNKSYVQGLDNLFNVLRDPTKNGEKFLGNIAGGYVPNIYNQAQNYQEDRMLRETRGILDYMIKRTHGAKSLMPRRNLLGEIETVPQDGLTGVFNPLYTKEIPDSIVDQEIGSMNVGFSKPATLLANNKNLDMRDFNNETDQTAYDRYAELVGTVKINKKTLRESLEELMRSSFYEGLPDAEEAADKGLKSPRIKEIQKYLRTFRSVAKREMLKEYPELNQAFLAEHQNKINLMEQ